MHANPPASRGPSLPEAPVYQMTSSPTQPTWAIRNVLQLDIVSTKRLNIILYKRQRGCKEEENSLLTELEDKLHEICFIFHAYRIYVRQPVCVPIVHLLVLEGKLLSAPRTVCTSGLSQMHLMHMKAFKIEIEWCKRRDAAKEIYK